MNKGNKQPGQQHGPSVSLWGTVKDTENLDLLCNFQYQTIGEVSFAYEIHLKWIAFFKISRESIEIVMINNQISIFHRFLRHVLPLHVTHEDRWLQLPDSCSVMKFYLIS